MEKEKIKKYRRFKKILRGILKNPMTYAVIAFPFVMALLIYVTFMYEGGVSMDNMGDSVWNFIVCFVAGYYDICVVTPVGRFCSFVILVLGILALSAVTGKIASIFMDIQMKKDKGLRKLNNITNHFLLCGWREGFEQILESVMNSNPDLTPDMIVLVNEAPSEEIEQIRSQLRFKGINYVSGDFSDIDTLTRACIKTAERALIISDQSQKFSELETDSRTVLAVLTMKNLNPELYIAAELFDEKFAAHLNLAHCDEIILTTAYECSLLATASSGMGYSNVISALLGEDAESGIIIENIDQKFIGKTYGELKQSVSSRKNTILIGILQNTGNFYQRRKDALREAQKNPDVSTIVESLKKVKTLKSNDPVFTPSDDFVIQPYAKAIFVKGK